MGNTCNSQQSYQTRFKNKYQFITQVHDHNFGDIKVYRKKQLNYDYVMILYKYIQSSKLPTVSKEIQLLHSAFLKKNQPMALRIFNYDIDNSQISNCSLSLVKIYVEYFNFTLHDLILNKKKKGFWFTHQELKYIIGSCVTAYKQFKEITQKNINITLKRAIKFCPIRNQQFYQHSTPVCNAICNQTVYKQVNSFQGGQKYLTGQIKKLFSQIMKLNYQLDPQAGKIYQLFDQIKKSHSISSLMDKVGSAKVQFLNITNSKIESGGLNSQIISNGIKNSNSSVSKPISSTSNFSQRYKTNDGDSVKLSLTKNTKLMNSKEYSKQDHLYNPQYK